MGNHILRHFLTLYSICGLLYKVLGLFSYLYISSLDGKSRGLIADGQEGRWLQGSGLLPVAQAIKRNHAGGESYLWPADCKPIAHNHGDNSCYEYKKENKCSKFYLFSILFHFHISTN